MSDVAKWKLRGPVQTLRTEVAEWDPERGVWQAPRGVSTVTFRPDGQASEGAFHNPDGSVARWARAYDEDGRVIEEQSWRDDGPRSRVIYSYDALGRPAAAERLAADGTRHETERCRYDSAGRKTQVILPPHDLADTREIHYAVEGTDWAYGAPGAAAFTVAYDDRGLPTEAGLHDVNGELLRHIVFLRDDHGRLLTEVVHCDGESPFSELPPADHLAVEERARMAATLKTAFAGQILCKTAYVYDAEGRLLERTIDVGSLSEERTIFEYGHYDDPIAEISSRRSYRVEIDDDGVVRPTEEEPLVEQHNRYDCQCDSRGNWTERAVSYRIGSQPEFQRSNIERRTITYYER